tara:strand:+ start:42890 stop:44086 length:1197 start_codon:yes stop_codon:yes gene_type:complete
MKNVFTLKNTDILEKLFSKECDGISEVVIAPKELARLGSIELKEVNALASKLKQHGKRVFLQWDILMTEGSFDLAVEQLKEIDWNYIDAIRVQDAGAYHYALENLETEIHLILEQGNHNLTGIHYWIEYAQKYQSKKLKRLVLSMEIPYERFTQFIKEIHAKKIEVEIMALGQILLFYSPRSLVKPLFEDITSDELNNDEISVIGNSEESPHKGFPITENIHGTFMFNTKDHCIVEYFEKLKLIELDAWRFDLSNDQAHTLITDISLATTEEAFQGIKEAYPEKVIQGFFKTNKSDVLFKKLKNKRISRKEVGFLGEVVDVKKKEHIGIHLKNPKVSFKNGQSLTFFTPEGKEKTTTVVQAWQANQKNISEASMGQVIFIPHLGGISTKTMVYDSSLL